MIRHDKLLLIRINENNSLIEIYEVNLEITEDLYKYYPIIEQDLHSNSYLINDHVLIVTFNGWVSSSPLIKITHASENGFLKNLSEEWIRDKEIGFNGCRIENFYGYNISVAINNANNVYYFNKNDICYKKEIIYGLFGPVTGNGQPIPPGVAIAPKNDIINISIPVPFNNIGGINAVIENGHVLIPVGSEVFTVDIFIMKHAHLIIENGKNNFLYEKAADLFKRQVEVIKDTHNAYLTMNRENINQPLGNTCNFPYNIYSYTDLPTGQY